MLPLVAAAYAVARRRRRRFAVRFPAAAIFASIRQPRLRRVLPAALLAAAAASLAVATARPQATMAVPVEKASVVLVTDESGSMSADRRRPVAARGRALGRQELPRPRAGQAAGRLRRLLLADQRGRRADARPRRRSSPRSTRCSPTAPPRPATRSTPRSTASPRAAARTASARPPRSSCSPTASAPQGSDPLAAAQRAKQLGIPVSTVALGTADGVVYGPQGQTLAGPARPRHAAGDQPHHRRHVHRGRRRRRLDEVYKRLGSKVGTKRVKQEVSSELRRRRPAPAARRARHRPAPARPAALIPG